jgi:hypothetical protein
VVDAVSKRNTVERVEIMRYLGILLVCVLSTTANAQMAWFWPFEFETTAIAEAFVDIKDPQGVPTGDHDEDDDPDGDGSALAKMDYTDEWPDAKGYAQTSQRADYAFFSGAVDLHEHIAESHLWGIATVATQGWRSECTMRGKCESLGRYVAMVDGQLHGRIIMDLDNWEPQDNLFAIEWFAQVEKSWLKLRYDRFQTPGMEYHLTGLVYQVDGAGAEIPITIDQYSPTFPTVNYPVVQNCTAGMIYDVRAAINRTMPLQTGAYIVKTPIVGVQNNDVEFKVIAQLKSDTN